MKIRVPMVVAVGCCAALAGVAVSQAGYAAQDPTPPKVTQVDPEQLAEVGPAPGAQRAPAAPSGGRVTGGAAAATATSISGVITATGNRAVKGYTIEAFTSDGNFIADTTTDALGRYAFVGLQAGPYKVRISGPAAGAAPWAMSWVGGASTMTKASVLVVGATGIKANVTLAPAATVTGKVAGVPAGSEVRVCGATFLDCRIAATAANGRFTVTGLAAGLDSIVVKPAGGTDLAFPKLPPRPGVLLQAGKTTDVSLDARTQAAPVVTIGGKVIRPSSPPPPPPDRTAPTVTSAKLTTEQGTTEQGKAGTSAKPTTEEGKRYVTVTANDGQGGSGLAKVQVRVGTSTLAPTRFTTDAIAAPGTGEVAVRVQDKAGNYSGWVVAK